jgi:hypothetical protein
VRSLGVNWKVSKREYFYSFWVLPLARGTL